ncbi:XrtA/PEP-CTERM system-associated ATPase [Pleionea sp. CnH1-48]|uniref:XrtA/PEP-CTERM system-associated ATPase n=1 Tax=Pleionea sp. CnH1-48 TaxID=2954494 RepID=UPI0020970DF6|nr:XrtA/PEP-CTERM system-associated ATPase [Pleionea sp. CnH1-48]MCO7223456.1 XrtA-associated ATPase [Pleionea sp. CnH1-48]
MYDSYYKFSGKPFQLAPDPFFFFGSSTHKRALAYLRYGLSQGEGFIIVTGDVGTGKSTLVRTLFGTLENKKDIVAGELNNTQLDSTDILRMVAATFGLAHKASEKTSLIKNLENFFIARQREGRRCMLVVDEAQNLPLESLEELRMLSNLFNDGKTLLQIFLLGQSEFREMLAVPHLEQVRQRITASYHLAHLNAEETQAYIEHRLKKVNWQDDPVFTAEAYQHIFDFTEGVPRRINSICDRLLLYGFLEEKHRIDGEIVTTVASEIAVEHPEIVAPSQPRHNLERAKAAGGGAPAADAGPLEERMQQLEAEMEAMKKRFKKEREYMRKIIQISLNFDDDDD